MTPDQLNHALDAMAAAAGDDPNLAPGLITVESGHWVDVLSAVRATCAALNDGLRREIVIHVGSQQETKVLTRAEAGSSGRPIAIWRLEPDDQKRRLQMSAKGGLRTLPHSATLTVIT
ncbi:hypothetical protein V8F63_06825 [Brevundimonas sp. LF-1]|uniref:hypothetical protein n=1 Tax=Brevundimonas sp. LF-1 TaxID=3126100 RepID=UPI0030DE8BBA